MGSVRTTKRVLFFVAAFSRYPEALEWARDWCQQTWGKISLESEPFEFNETDYYETTMGRDLIKRFFVFRKGGLPDELPARKLLSNQAENELAATERFASVRPLNLDPGYMNASKIVLASTKDHAHRLYLGNGIFGEITLRFRHGHWGPWEWTYPDYRRSDYHAFFDECRALIV